MFEAGRLGQKNGKGFYAWKPEKKGPPSKQSDPEAKAIVAGLAKGKAEVSDEEIVERTMLPMLLECSRCLEDGDRRDARSRWTSPFSTASASRPSAAGSSAGPTPIGAPALLKAAEKHRGLGALYAPTKQLTTLAGVRPGLPRGVRP